MKKKIKTLDDFADVLNSCAAWTIEHFNIIRENGWNDNTHLPYGICDDGKNKLEFDEKGNAVVTVL